MESAGRSLDQVVATDLAFAVGPRLNAAEAFRAAFEQEVGARLDPAALRGEIWSDGELQAEDFTLDTATTLRFAGPWGQGFPAPLFDSEFRVLGSRLVGERHLRLDLGLPGGNGRLQAIAFNAEDMKLGSDDIHLVYWLDVNRYQGESQLQLIVEDWVE
jgi:single-stranded-DNA-specific exonuclease